MQLPSPMTLGKMHPNRVPGMAFAAMTLTFALCGCELYKPELNTVAEQGEFTCAPTRGVQWYTVSV